MYAFFFILHIIFPVIDLAVGYSMGHYSNNIDMSKNRTVFKGNTPTAKKSEEYVFFKIIFLRPH
jgi:hypothetical protein